MKTSAVFAFIFVVGLVVARESTVDALDAKCKGIDVKIKEEHVAKFKDCLKAVGVEQMSDLSANNAGCFSKCAMEKQGLVDAAGKLHKENVMKTIDANLPAELVEPWKIEIGKCLDNEGTKIKSPDDAKCTSYLPIAMCSHRAFLSLCK